MVAFQIPPRWHNVALGVGFGSLHPDFRHPDWTD